MEINFKNFLLFFLAIPGILIGQDGWKLSNSKDEINIYTRKVEGFGLKEYKVELIIDHDDIADVVELILEVDKYSDWSHKLKDVKRISSAEDLIEFYAVQETPWPAKDRQMCCRIKISDNDTNRFHANLSSYIGSDCSECENCVQVPKLHGQWLVERMDDGTIHIRHQVLTDPGGSIPDWMANAFVTDYPMKSFKKFVALLKS